MPKHDELQKLVIELRKKFNIDLVLARDVKKQDSLGYDDYDSREKKGQSETHRDMRIYSEKFLKKLGYSILPYAVGVKGCFTFSDFLVYREDRLVFVECLTDRNIKQATIDRKSQLLKYGELCFIVYGGHYGLYGLEHRLPNPAIDTLAQQFDVFSYFGAPINNEKDRIAPYNSFNRVLYDIRKGEKINLKISFKLQGQNAVLIFNFINKGYHPNVEYFDLKKILAEVYDRGHYRKIRPKKIKDNDLDFKINIERHKFNKVFHNLQEKLHQHNVDIEYNLKRLMKISGHIDTP